MLLPLSLYFIVPIKRLGVCLLISNGLVDILLQVKMVGLVCVAYFNLICIDFGVFYICRMGC